MCSILYDIVRWNPDLMDPIALELAADMYTFAYNSRQLIHRPFIPASSPTSPSAQSPTSATGAAPSPAGRPPLSFPSLAICTNAARSCANVLDVARQRGLMLTPGAAFGAFASATTLSIATWGAKDSGVKMDSTIQLDINKCRRYLLLAEDVYLFAGRTA